MVERDFRALIDEYLRSGVLLASSPDAHPPSAPSHRPGPFEAPDEDDTAIWESLQRVQREMRRVP